MLLPTTYDTRLLQKSLDESIFSKTSVEIFIDVYQESKKYLDGEVFCSLRLKIEDFQGKLNLKKRLDRAWFGYWLSVGELSYRKALPSGFSPLYLFDNSPRERYVEDLQQELGSALEGLRIHKEFCRLLILGRILPKPTPTNGIEHSPLFRVFGSPITLDELHQSYKILRQHHHPDSSPKEYKEAKERFIWLRYAYQLILNNWSRFDPCRLEIDRQRVSKLLSHQLNWEPDSFWYWQPPY